MTTVTKIKATKIIIERAEGPSHLCTNTEHKTWAEAESRIFQIRSTVGDLGYDKCDFYVHFEDGTIYSGRYDAENMNKTSVGLSQHINSYLSYLAGLHCPSRLTKEQYQDAIDRHEKWSPGITGRSMAVLENYSFED